MRTKLLDAGLYLIAHVDGSVPCFESRLYISPPRPSFSQAVEKK